MCPGCGPARKRQGLQELFRCSMQDCPTMQKCPTVNLQLVAPVFGKLTPEVGGAQRVHCYCQTKRTWHAECIADPGGGGIACDFCGITLEQLRMLAPGLTDTRQSDITCNIKSTEPPKRKDARSRVHVFSDTESLSDSANITQSIVDDITASPSPKRRRKNDGDSAGTSEPCIPVHRRQKRRRIANSRYTENFMDPGSDSDSLPEISTSVGADNIIPQLIEMGYPKEAAGEAAKNVSTTEEAIDWLDTNMEDPANTRDKVTGSHASFSLGATSSHAQTSDKVTGSHASFSLGATSSHAPTSDKVTGSHASLSLGATSSHAPTSDKEATPHSVLEPQVATLQLVTRSHEATPHSVLEPQLASLQQVTRSQEATPHSVLEPQVATLQQVTRAWRGDTCSWKKSLVGEQMNSCQQLQRATLVRIKKQQPSIHSLQQTPAVEKPDSSFFMRPWFTPKDSHAPFSPGASTSSHANTSDKVKGSHAPFSPGASTSSHANTSDKVTGSKDRTNQEAAIHPQLAADTSCRKATEILMRPWFTLKKQRKATPLSVMVILKPKKNTVCKVLLTASNFNTSPDNLLRLMDTTSEGKQWADSTIRFGHSSGFEGDHGIGGGRGVGSDSGHPEVIVDNFEDLSHFYGVMKCKVLPPPRLFHPVLTCRCVKDAPDREEKENEYIQKYKENEGIELDRENIKSNPGMRALARSNFTKAEFVTSPTRLFQLIRATDIEIRGSDFSTDQIAEVHYANTTDYIASPPNTNIYIAAFTTAHARLKLFKTLDKLGDAVRYYDTDSIICRCNDSNRVELGDYLGEFSNEVETNGGYITEFCSGGTEKLLIRSGRRYNCQQECMIYSVGFTLHISEDRSGRQLTLARTMDRKEYQCKRCRILGKDVLLKGHKGNCPWQQCMCDGCEQLVNYRAQHRADGRANAMTAAEIIGIANLTRRSSSTLSATTKTSKKQEARGVRNQEMYSRLNKSMEQLVQKTSTVHPVHHLRKAIIDFSAEQSGKTKTGTPRTSTRFAKPVAPSWKRLCRHPDLAWAHSFGLGSFAVASSLSSTSKDGVKEVAKAPSVNLTTGGTPSVQGDKWPREGASSSSGAPVYPYAECAARADGTCEKYISCHVHCHFGAAPALGRENLEPRALERENLEHTQAEDPHVADLDNQDLTDWDPTDLLREEKGANGCAFAHNKMLASVVTQTLRFSGAAAKTRPHTSYFELLANTEKYPDRRFGYSIHRKKNLTVRKYFNQRLLDADGRFAKDVDYPFAAQGRMMQGGPLNAGVVKNAANVAAWFRTDAAYKFLKNARGSPPYWQKVLYQVLAMVRQLGTPTWFLTLSAADMHWPEIIQSIGKQYGQDFTPDDIAAMPWQDKCDWLNRNPVTDCGYSIAPRQDVCLHSSLPVSWKSIYMSEITTKNWKENRHTAELGNSGLKPSLECHTANQQGDSSSILDGQEPPVMETVTLNDLDAYWEVVELEDSNFQAGSSVRSRSRKEDLDMTGVFGANSRMSPQTEHITNAPLQSNYFMPPLTSTPTIRSNSNDTNRFISQLPSDGVPPFQVLQLSSVQSLIPLGSPNLGVMIFPSQLLNAELTGGGKPSCFLRKLMDMYFTKHVLATSSCQCQGKGAMLL
ncbi:hypothetical protein Bbelb_317340 [Branchiostoma belcheri]|nr:hypothetical protein Bbelb_317340 [Branchiostoma belcheri]